MQWHLSGVKFRRNVAIAVFVCVAVFAGLAWSVQGDDYSFSIDRHEVSDLYFLNKSVGWISLADHNSGKCYVFRTEDGGNTWTKWNASNGLFRIWFVSKSLGWALRQVGSSNRGAERVYLLRTRNGGRTWRQISRIPMTSQADLSAYAGARFAFIDASHGWFVGSFAFSPLLETSDGGVTTHIVRSLPERRFFRIYASADQGVWIYGSVPWHSTNLGKTWTSPVNLRALKTSPYIFETLDIDLLRDGHGWLVGDDPYGMILKTVDYGRHWKRVLDDQEITTFSSVSFWDDSNGCATGDPTFLVCTQDGGTKWVTRNVLPRATDNQEGRFINLVMLKSGRGWLLRLGGYLYTTVDSGQTWYAFDPLR